MRFATGMKKNMVPMCDAHYSAAARERDQHRLMIGELMPLPVPLEEALRRHAQIQQTPGWHNSPHRAMNAETYTMFSIMPRRVQDPNVHRQRRLEPLEVLHPRAPPPLARDPEGGIDLRAFAADSQSVHRGSVQSAAQKAIDTLMLRTVPETQDTIVEAAEALKHVLEPAPYNRVLMVLNRDYVDGGSFGVRYSDVMDRVWTIVNSHAARDELVKRLGQELYEGIHMCTNGKIARLINALQGFDNTLDVSAPVASMEMFQNKISTLIRLPLGEREAAARALFTEYAVPEAEQAAWLEPLLDE
jgi:hypothetical protein